MVASVVVVVSMVRMGEGNVDWIWGRMLVLEGEKRLVGEGTVWDAREGGLRH